MSYEEDVEIRIGLRKEIRVLKDEKNCLARELSDKEAELARLRAVNAELVEALQRIANTCENFDGCPVGPQTIAEVARAALSRAEQAKPEVKK